MKKNTYTIAVTLWGEFTESTTTDARAEALAELRAVMLESYDARAEYEDRELTDRAAYGIAADLSEEAFVEWVGDYSLDLILEAEEFGEAALGDITVTAAPRG